MRTGLYLLKMALTAALAAPLALPAQDKPRFVPTGTPWGVRGISGNENWICGVRQYQEAYRFNISTGQLERVFGSTASSQLAALDIADDGTMIGLDDDGFPSIYRSADKGWENLPCSVEIYSSNNASAANACTPDGKYIVGMLSIKPDETKPYSIIPTVWTRQDNGEYKDEALPEPPTDFTGGTPQFVSPRKISSDGNIIIGPIVDQSGSYATVLMYQREGDGWTYTHPLLDYCYHLDRFKELLAEEPDYNEYITKRPGETGYMAQVRNFQKHTFAWQYKLYTEGTTCRRFSATPTMSDNGLYLAGQASEDVYTLAADSSSIDVKSTVFPAYYRTDTKEVVEFKSLVGFSPNNVTNQGDFVTSDENAEEIYLMLHDRPDQLISLTDWLKNVYDFDLWEYLPSNTIENTNPHISGKGKLITGRYKSATEDNELDVQEIYCLVLPDVVSGIKQLLSSDTPAYIHADNGTLRFDSPAGNVRVYDISGRQLAAEAGTVSSLSVPAQAGTTCIVRATCGGNDIRAKVIMK